MKKNRRKYMRHLMIVGDLFEDVECLATLDVLKRGDWQKDL